MKQKLTSILLGAGAALVAGAASRKLADLLPEEKWDRKSFSEKTVSLKGGLINASAATATAFSQLPRVTGVAASIAAASGAIAGYIDDHLENSFPAKGKGFRGHLGALKNGQLSSGMMKIILVGTGSLVSAAVIAVSEKGIDVLPAQVAKSPRLAESRKLGVPLQTLENTLIIAGTANLFNLLDLRPGRALKIGAVAAVPFLFSEKSRAGLAAGLITGNLMSLPQDLSGAEMLGDLGANSLGASIGTLIAVSNSQVTKIISLGAVLGLNIASEKISFSKVIAENKVLNYLDMLGRNSSPA